MGSRMEAGGNLCGEGAWGSMPELRKISYMVNEAKEVSVAGLRHTFAFCV